MSMFKDIQYKEELKSKIEEQVCPECGRKGSDHIGIDNWAMFYGKEDWFYFCKECDVVF